MSLNRTKKQWVLNPDGSRGYVWDPMPKIRGTPKDRPEHILDPEKLTEPYRLKKPSRILTSYRTDLFSPLNRENWIGEVLFLMNGLRRHDFIIVTDQEEGILKWAKFIPRGNVWLGVRLNCQEHMKRLFCLRMAETNVKFILIDSLEQTIELDLFGLDWIVMDGDSKGKLSEEAVRSLLEQARDSKIPVFLAGNYCITEKIQRFPKQ